MGEFPPLSTPGATRPRRKVTVDAETLDAVPECVRAFLAFMQARGSLSGEPLEVLEQALDVLGEEFKTHAQDRSRWGLAKSMFMRMPTEGVDPSQPSAIDAWMDDFNSRPPEERDAIIGPAADRVARSAGIRIPNGSRASKPRGLAAQRRRRRHASATGEADPLTPPSGPSEVASTGASAVGRGLRIPPTQRKCNRPFGPLRSAISADALLATPRLLLTLWLRKPGTAFASVSKRANLNSAERLADARPVRRQGRVQRRPRRPRIPRLQSSPIRPRRRCQDSRRHFSFVAVGAVLTRLLR